jgi:hypothetical protein
MFKLALIPLILGLPPQMASAVELGIDGRHFTLDGKPTFLLGTSAYAALGEEPARVERDLDTLAARGHRWVRVWATWAAFDNDVSAVDADGHPREPYLQRLKDLVASCDRRGLIVDVTISRGNGVTGPPRLQAPEAHRRAVVTLVEALGPMRNWYLDLSNERNIKDQRFTSIAELAALRTLVREMDPKRLVTASHAGDLSEGDVRAYLDEAKLDFVAVHRPRHEKSASQTADRTRAVFKMMKTTTGRVVPVHYQEPFRRGFGRFQPEVQDYLIDLKGAIEAGAAGWCLHSGDTRDAPDGAPRRVFDLREHGLIDGLDPVEREVFEAAARIVTGR